MPVFTTNFRNILGRSIVKERWWNDLHHTRETKEAARSAAAATEAKEVQP